MVSIFNQGIHAFTKRAFIITISAIFFGLAIFSTNIFADSESLYDSESFYNDFKKYLVLNVTEPLRNDELNLIETSAVDAVRAVDYAESIYNYLTNTMQPTQVTMNTNVYTLKNAVNDIKNMLSGGSTSNEYIYDIISRICDRGLGVPASSSTRSWLEIIYSELHEDNFGSGFSGEHLRDFVIAIYMILGHQNYGLQAISNSLNNISANTSISVSYEYQNGIKLDTANSNLSTINTSIVSAQNTLTHIDSNTYSTDLNTASIDSKMSDILDHIHSLDWTSYNCSPINFFHSIDSSVVTGTVVSPVGNDNDYYYFSFTGNNFYDNNSKVLDFCLPLYTTSSIHSLSLSGIAYNTNTKLPFKLEYNFADSYGYHFIVYLLEPIPVNQNINVIFKVDSGSWRLSQDAQGNISNAFIKYIPFNSTDFHVMLDSLSNAKLSDDVDKLRKVYASDKEIAAREEASPIIDSALDSFSGDGSNALSLSDISSASSISSSLENGLNSGGSVGNGLSMFSPNNSSFWGWFSQDNAQYFTNNNNRKTYNPNAIPDFLTPIDNEVYLHLGE